MEQMEEDFENLHPTKFLDKYTLQIATSKDLKKNQKLSKQILIKILNNDNSNNKGKGKGKGYIKYMKFLTHYKSRIRKPLYKLEKKLLNELNEKINHVKSTYILYPEELQIGDQCMIAEPIFHDEEREMFMKYTKPYMIYMKLNIKKILSVHVWTVFQDVNKREKFVMMMHGFGLGCSKHDWMKLVYPLYQRGFNIIMVDFPGFGRSCGRDLNSLIWKPSGNQMIFKILNHFKAKNISVFADCGGAATFLKLLVAKPKLFGKRHVLIRPTMGHFPHIEPVLEKYKMKMWVTWIVDSNHPRCHASFRNWKRLNKEMKNNVKLVVQDGYVDDKITYYDTQYTPNITRTGSSFNLFNFNENYLRKIFNFFDN